ncbi:sensor domain-containing diguanylate cyclase [Brucella thiophenivorans]|nr:sensor domain-containing diguanylate cyclase [Brucella thiophenivorans]
MLLHDKHRLAVLTSYNTIEMGQDRTRDALCNLVLSTFGVPMAAVSLVDEHVTHHIGMAGCVFGDLPNENTFCSHTIESTDPFLIEDATSDDRFATNPFVKGDPGVRFYLGAPLVAPDGSTLGAICALDTKTRLCTLEEKAKLASLASTAVEILNMRRHMREARKLALVDGLTGIANRTGIELEIEKAIIALRNHGLPFSLLYFDVDRFKQVNDERGHAAGDELLRLIGETLVGRNRPDEVSARPGGDEFIVLRLGGTKESDLAEAQQIKAMLDDEVSRAGFCVSFSMGLVSFTAAPTDVAGAIYAADALLYDAKRRGKNLISTGEQK